ncbi:MAG TPA: phage terminase large subunit [Polyangiaceae bacterium]|nr:phage terminase large subunit [Polyangiaceae bacterium]
MSASSPAATPLQLRAAAELERRRRARERESLYEYIPRVNPRYQAPRHLAPFVEQLERSWREPVRCTGHAPPRHTKTDTVCAFIAQTLRKWPHKRFAYVSYSADVAHSKSKNIRALAQADGLRLRDDEQAAGRWSTPEGGGLSAAGIGGPLTSFGFDWVFIDDPYKWRQDAESAAYRRTVIDWWLSVAHTRVQPGGSVFIFHTRWVEDDLIGFVHDTYGTTRDGSGPWVDVVMPAVNEAGEPLWPEGGWTLAMLEPHMLDAYTWNSIYQGRPGPRGGKLFHAPHYYDEFPNYGRDAFGLDLGYTDDTLADFSVATNGRLHDGRIYLRLVERRQLEADDFAAVMKQLRRDQPNAPWRMIGSGTEKGALKAMSKLAGFPVKFVPAAADKLVRALGTVAAWNKGLILLPKRADWLDEFRKEVARFTGVRDPKDDQVDSLVALHDELLGTTPVAASGLLSINVAPRL